MRKVMIIGGNMGGSGRMGNKSTWILLVLIETVGAGLN